MAFEFSELDSQDTPIGRLSLRRRAEPRLQGKIVYEVKLGLEWLMSSLFTEAETQLGRLGVAALEGDSLDIVVGGLGLGYTAAAVLESERVGTLRVVEYLDPVIRWHQEGLVPLGETLVGDKRCTLVSGDFFELSTSTEKGFDNTTDNPLVHAILLDIDHSPTKWLTPGNSEFYSAQGITALAAKLHDNGVFGLWSDDPPDEQFMAFLKDVFTDTQAHVINFPNPYSGGQSSGTVYIAVK